MARKRTPVGPSVARPPFAVDQKNRKKIAIVGFTQHRQMAPFFDDAYEIWGLNDLYHELPESIYADRLRWFQIHGWIETAHHKFEPVTDHPLNFGGGPPHPRDPNHVPWLATHAKHMPVYLMEPRPEVPDALVYPREDVYRYFSMDGAEPTKYFTNSISWMLAIAIMKLVPGGIGTPAVDGAEISVWGVDMMMAGGAGSEYGYQRPSCEWLLGMARGCGIRVVIPKESDLLKTAFVYGDHKSEVYRAKLMNHRAELVGRRNAAQAELNRMQQGVVELSGAINVLDWQLKSWMPGDYGDMNGGVPMPDAHKVAPPQ